MRLAVIDRKKAYDDKHMWKAFHLGERIIIYLHKGYTLPVNRRSQQAIINLSKLPIKLQRQFAGLYEIIECVGRLAYRLQLPEDYNIHLVLLVSLLELWPENDSFYRLEGDEPVSFDPDGVLRYEVEIVDKEVRRSGRNRQPVVRYRVRWKGFPSDKDWWMSLDDLLDAKDAIEDYKKAQSTG